MGTMELGGVICTELNAHYFYSIYNTYLILM